MKTGGEAGAATEEDGDGGLRGGEAGGCVLVVGGVSSQGFFRIEGLGGLGMGFGPGY